MIALDPATVGVDIRLFLNLGLCALVHFFLNSGSVALAVSLATGRKVKKVFTENLLWASLTNVAGAAAAAIIFLTFDNTPLFAVVVTVPIILVIFYAYKMNLNRIRQAQQHISDMDRLYHSTITSLAESPLDEELLYAGTDDGVIQVLENGEWRRIDSFPGVPEMTYVSRIEASLHDTDTVYATFNNKKKGDFKPYVFVSRDRGRTWSSITGDLPEREVVYALMQDHVEPDLLFAGTEFGMYVSFDDGRRWQRLHSGRRESFPTGARRSWTVC